MHEHKYELRTNSVPEYGTVNTSIKVFQYHYSNTLKISLGIFSFSGNHNAKNLGFFPGFACYKIGLLLFHKY